MEPAVSIFISHGAPTYALEPGLAGAQLRALGESLPRPQAVLAVSPHWMTGELRVATSAKPETIHDFGGFPKELYRLQYPAPGHPVLAASAATLLEKAGYRVHLDAAHGLDHGAWVPLMHLFPHADVPVFQVSLPARLDAAGAWRLGESLAPLSAQGVLILGSGSLTHNLQEFRQSSGAEATYVTEFVGWIRNAVLRHDRQALEHAIEQAPHALRAHPTPEHFLPLLIAAGAAPADAPVRVLCSETRYGVISMESYLFGPAGAADAGK